LVERAEPARRIAALYDIHGNLPALEAVMDDVRLSGADHIVVGGDVVPGPMPHETLAFLLALDLPVTFIQGNGEREVLAEMRGGASSAIPQWYRDTMRWVADQVRPYEQLLANLPLTVRRSAGRFERALFCHATPQNDTDIFTRRTPEERLRPIFDAADALVVICGHTHMQFDRTIGATRVVNAGSVGMPFCEAGAYWLLIGPEDVQLRRTAYDLAAAAERVRKTACPTAEEFAARNILEPPSEEQMLSVFTDAGLK
jgi:predicted phosphodiesterase